MEPAGEDAARKPETHVMGQDLSLLSIEEIDRRIAWLQAEILRLEAERRNKDHSKAAAEALFRR